MWQYSSATAAKNDTSTLSPCIGETVGSNQAACRPEPLIFLRYDFGLALDKTAEAGQVHEITVVAYRNASATIRR
ncbi:hypothetical protein AB0E04_46210 [Streptomyces sp. NPDC048251]|uniref:hypothetical protein n=1 Tax=Streptomyces sp. NPDC048251 TaxID=3154501 RepID=UPI00344ACFD2